MKRIDAVKYLDDLENACCRAEFMKKDKDLLVALRACYVLMYEWIKEKEREEKK